MSQFNSNKWFKNQYLKEANLDEKQEDQKVLKEEKSKNDRIFDVFYDELEDFDGVAEYLKRYKNMIIRRLESIDFDYLPKPSMMEEAEEMATYKVTVTLAEPGEGGPDYDEDVEVKVDASLSGDELKSAVRDAIGKEGYNRKNIYKFKYEKA